MTAARGSLAPVFALALLAVVAAACTSNAAVIPVRAVDEGPYLQIENPNCQVSGSKTITVSGTAVVSAIVPIRSTMKMVAYGANGRVVANATTRPSMLEPRKSYQWHYVLPLSGTPAYCRLFPSGVPLPAIVSGGTGT
ncbi:MAG TPA: hypothetical protein VHB02_11925 [Acidimicrobiales bacterium]|nr:hypothetical protein [Acidimicrobiales bacterium]